MTDLAPDSYLLLADCAQVLNLMPAQAHVLTDGSTRFMLQAPQSNSGELLDVFVSTRVTYGVFEVAGTDAIIVLARHPHLGANRWLVLLATESFLVDEGMLVEGEFLPEGTTEEAARTRMRAWVAERADVDTVEFEDEEPESDDDAAPAPGSGQALRADAARTAKSSVRVPTFWEWLRKVFS